jgi:hypothetical protein
VGAVRQNEVRALERENVADFKTARPAASVATAVRPAVPARAVHAPGPTPSDKATETKKIWESQRRTGKPADAAVSDAASMRRRRRRRRERGGERGSPAAGAGGGEARKRRGHS